MTDDHLAAFAKFGVRRVLLMAHTISPRLLDAGIECHYLPFPPGVDANKYAIKMRERSQSLKEIIAKAVGLEAGVCPVLPIATETTREPSEVAVSPTRPAVRPTCPATAKVPRPRSADSLGLCLNDDQKLLAQIIDYYHRTLKETTEGLDYLRSRGVTVGEAIDRFRIGYANRTLGLEAAGRCKSRPASKSAPACSNSASSEAHRPRTLLRLRDFPHHGR